MATAATTEGVFKFISNSTLRKSVEVLVSAIPGAVVLFLFILGTGILNIYTNLAAANEIFAATYLPVICLLPLVIGVIGPLILEKVRNATELSLRASVLTAFLSGFFGSFFGGLTLIIAGFAEFKPFGGILSDVLPGAGRMLFASFLLVIISTVLSTLGGALIVILLKKAEK
ncbi:MAG: hypothetical protein WC492_00405 [Candidatus Micrarchaeia archaeon]